MSVVTLEYAHQAGSREVMLVTRLVLENCCWSPGWVLRFKCARVASIIQLNTQLEHFELQATPLVLSIAITVDFNGIDFKFGFHPLTRCSDAF